MIVKLRMIIILEKAHYLWVKKINLGDVETNQEK